MKTWRWIIFKLNSLLFSGYGCFLYILSKSHKSSKNSNTSQYLYLWSDWISNILNGFSLVHWFVRTVLYELVSLCFFHLLGRHQTDLYAKSVWSDEMFYLATCKSPLSFAFCINVSNYQVTNKVHKQCSNTSPPQSGLCKGAMSKFNLYHS